MQLVDIETAGMLKNFLHDSEIYGGRVAYCTSDEMKGKVTIFPSGKLISIGAKSVKQAVNNLHRDMNALLENKLVKKTNLSDIKVQNIRASVNFEKKIDLEKIPQKLNAVYEPKQFPGAILRFENPKVTTLIFASGKAIITGAKNVESINDTVSTLYELLFS